MTRWGAAAALIAAAPALAGCDASQVRSVHLSQKGPAVADAAPDAAYPRVVDGAVVYTATVESWYDGDTVTLIKTARTGRDTWLVERIKGRVAHIDAPEVRGDERPRHREVRPDSRADQQPGWRERGVELLRTGHAAPYEGGAR